MFPEEVDSYFRKLAREAPGEELDLSAGSPLKQLIGRFVEITLEEEMNEHLGYDRCVREPSKQRENTRNGYSKKQLKTSQGDAEIRVPRDRNGTYEPVVVPKHKGITSEVEERVISMYAMGMTTRDIQQHVRELYGFDASEMFVSRLVERLDPELRAWRNRPLQRVYAIGYVDAFHIKVRHAHGVRSSAVYMVSGYGEGGYLELLGLYMATEGTGESAAFWHQVFVELEGRGLERILILCSDQLPGLEQAVETVYPQASYQPCVVHLMRTSLRRVPHKHRRGVARDFRAIYQAPTYEPAEEALEKAQEAHSASYPAAVAVWTRALPLLSNLWRYGPALRRVVYTINPLENINRQFRKVTKNRGVLPHTESALRLPTLVAMRIDAKAAKRPRADWPRILGDLSIAFEKSIPEHWGNRY